MISADIPNNFKKEFEDNYNNITKNTDRLFLFAGDHKIEHMAQDFYGSNIDESAESPEHFFEIAVRSNIGAFATQMGLIARYGNQKNYNTINYIVKLNSKTNLIDKDKQDPLSLALWSVEDVVAFKKKSNLKISGVGYTIYLGSLFEEKMLTQAAQIVYQAHQNGLVAILWMYPRGVSIKDDHAGIIIAGAAGVANALGADFVKVVPPTPTKNSSTVDMLNLAQKIAGNTKIICAGGASVDPKVFLKNIYEQINVAKYSAAP